jgi:exopolysaccharide biosynthesis protein
VSLAVTGAFASAAAFTDAAAASTTPGQYNAQVAINVTAKSAPAPGLTYEKAKIETGHGHSNAYVLIANTSNSHLSVGPVHAAHVAQRATVTGLASASHAFAAVNADFFDVNTYDESGYATEAPNGPVIVNGRLLKGAVPLNARYGPAESTGATGHEVIGAGADGKGQVSDVQVAGTVTSQGLSAPIAGYNQFAIPDGGIDVFDAGWGPASRHRATCGDSLTRKPPCLTSGVTEVIVRGGKVLSVSDKAGGGQLRSTDLALVGREAGAQQLAQLKVGQPVSVTWHAVQGGGDGPLRWAVGGIANVAGGQPVAGLSNSGLNPITVAGVGADGKTFYIVVVDGRTTASAGVTTAEAAVVLQKLGASDGVQFDGGGSSQLVMRSGLKPSDQYKVLNVPSDGKQRPVPNGIGVFVR